MSDRAPAGVSYAQQGADALHAIATNDGTPISHHVVTGLLDDAFISLLIHDTARHPIDASPRRRTPTRRQRRVIDARQPTCTETGCHARTLLQYDHHIPSASGGNTTLDNLDRRCGPHNRQKSSTPA